ncbi:DUF106 domain-containing protein [Methanonatronarchaeum sp. AMET6-2]|uniref:DUF106 domain-containing protein n=1 Tax=Methanonatronarchaeum sp. AMET6-2 TaxID=2933293 RepID=UPI001205C5DB|nr:EMC3/TMCO1 family protein [Methanonatronarchaeum sp. AMET6-2]RZN62974.1 MAG: DUF106 domain-containing protein [Methanonatronarchaeia archaeon]UOY10725.1 EMC3/TMCO1 family protein [Methanonatronarchaeum sp. AMET6-2]
MSREALKDLVEKIVLFLAIGLMLAIFLDPGFFPTLGEVANNAVLSPLTALPIELAIMVVAAFNGFLSSIAQKYGMDMEEQKERQKKMKELSNKIKEARMAGDEGKLKKLEQERTELTQELMGNLTKQFKPMLYILVITIPFFAWVYYVSDPANAIYETPKMLLPFLGEVDFSVRAWGMVPAWIIWYIVCSIPISQVARKAMKVGI